MSNFTNTNYKLDIIVCLVFLSLAIFVHMGRIGSSIGGIDLSTDTANYATMAAAMSHPDVFAKDPVYNDKDRYGVHVTNITILVNYIADIFRDGKDYSLAYLDITGFQFFFHHLTFYILGIVLLKKRWQAFIFTMLMGQIYWISWGTYWGDGYIDHLPRTTFATFYALFVVAALKILDKPKKWPIFMVGIGLMVYIHSISTLPTAFGFWLGFACYKPKESTWKKHIAWMFFCGLCFLVVIFPFVLKYIRPSIEFTASDIALLKEILLLRYDWETTYYVRGLLEFVWHYILLPVFPLGIIGFVLMRCYGNTQDRVYAIQFACWSVGPLVCVLLYALDHELAKILGRNPLQFDLIRVVRFWVFFAFCLTFMGFNVLWQHAKQQNIRYLAGFLWIAFAIGLFFGGQHDAMRASALWFWNKLDDTRYATAYAEKIQHAEMLKAIQDNTPKDALIFSNDGDRTIRYKALRPLVYSWKDTSLYYYAKDMDGIRFWYAMQKALKVSPTAYINLALDNKAEYIVSSRVQDKEALLKVGSIVWQSPYYLLVKVN